MLYADITKMLAIVWNARSRKDLIKQIVFDLEYTHLWKDGQHGHRIHRRDETGKQENLGNGDSELNVSVTFSAPPR